MSFIDAIWFWAARSFGEFLSFLFIVFWIAIALGLAYGLWKAYEAIRKASARIASHCRFDR